MEIIQIVFEKQTQYGLYRDALYFPKEQLPPLDNIERLKQERVDNWISIITSPPAEEGPQNGE